MNQLTTQKPNVQLKAGHAVTTSLAIAEAFGKQHKDVLRLLKNLDCSEEFNQRNFAPVEYRDGKGQNRPMYEVTRDGFIFVGMGFTGAAAGAMKEAYINAFNAMEARLVADMPRPGQVESLSLRRVAEALTSELLRANPDRRKVLRYRKMGLSVREISRLTGVGQGTLRREITLFETCGMLDVTPRLAQLRITGLKNLKGGVL